MAKFMTAQRRSAVRNNGYATKTRSAAMEVAATLLTVKAVKMEAASHIVTPPIVKAAMAMEDARYAAEMPTMPAVTGNVMTRGRRSAVPAALQA